MARTSYSQAPAHYLQAALVSLLACVFCFSTGCSVSAGGASTSQTQSSENEAATGTVHANFFGMVVKAAGASPTVAAGSRRLWDSNVTWAAIEPSRGVFDWSTLDAEVAAGTQSGVQLTLTLGMTPTWASSQPAAASSYGAGAPAMPANLADWDSYVAAVASRYAGRIQAYEVWNAPEDPRYWSGSTTGLGSAMATLSVHAAAAVHSADAEAQIVSPALSPAGLAAFLVSGGGSSVDIIGASLNTSDAGTSPTPEQMITTIDQLRAALVGTVANGKPIWNDQGSWTLPQGGLSSSMQAAYVARALLLNAGYGVARIHWYAWDENSSAALLLSSAEAQPTAAGLAYSTVESWLVGATVNGCSATAGGLWTCQLISQGHTEWVLWSVSGSIETSSLGAVTATALDGTLSSLGSTLTVGPAPVLLQ